MKSRIKLTILMTLFSLGSFAVAFAQDANKLLQNSEEQLFPDCYYSVMRINTHKPGKRDTSMTLESYYEKESGTFMEITDPARQKGIRFLQDDTTLYMFNPRSNSRNALRLSPESSFQGSVFSNNDVSNPKYAEDYDAVLLPNEIISHEELGEVECYVIEGTASHRKAPYGSIRMWTTVEQNIPLRIEYYAKSGLLFKVMEFSDLKQLAGKLRPAYMKMESLDVEGAYSEVYIDELESIDDIPDSRFSRSSLVR